MRYLSLAIGLLLVLPSARPAAQSGGPKLVVVLAVDQMRGDYPVRYGKLLEKGLKRLTTQGAWYQNAAYPYMATLTCVGHTTISTGTFPFKHGIIQNAWYDREAGKSVTCTEDADVTEISYGSLNGAGDSAKRMLMPSLAETLKKDAKARVVTMSLKARSAIALAGHAADSVVWFDDRGAWQSSSAYSKAPLDWMAAFIKGNPVERDADKKWERTLPEGSYTGSDEAPGERPGAGWTPAFPHALGAAGDRAYYAHWQSSPFADEYLEQMAEAAIDANHLGKGEGVDFLGISFSTMDMIGHAFGPRSHEIQDEMVRLDRTLGRLLSALDEKVGAGNYVLALSADHGVADVPEQVQGAGRVISSVINGAIDAALKPSFGEGPFVAAVGGSDVYLKPGVYEKMKANKDALQLTIDTLSKLSGVARVLTADQVSPESARSSKDAQVRATALSYYPGRSGDLIIIPKENWIMGAAVTTHGTLNPYDQRVPVILYGAGIRPGVRTESASPADIAPTLASIAGVRLPSPDGKVLSAALKK